MIVRLHLPTIRAQGQFRSPGYAAAVESSGQVSGEHILIEMENFSVILKAHPRIAEFPLRGLGDLVEKAVKPIAKALNLPCLDEQGRLRPESGCAKRRDAFNKAVPFRASKPA